MQVYSKRALVRIQLELDLYLEKFLKVAVSRIGRDPIALRVE